MKVYYILNDGQPITDGHDDYETREEAEKAVAQLEVEKGYRYLEVLEDDECEF